MCLGNSGVYFFVFLDFFEMKIVGMLFGVLCLNVNSVVVFF